MKRLFSVFAVSLLTVASALSQNSINVHFDERVELVSTIFRLAGAREYSSCPDETYANMVEDQFGQFRQTEAVQLASTYHYNGISYDAVASYAMHLKSTGDPSKPFVYDRNIKKGSDSSFTRWSARQKKTFIKALNEFYTETGFHDWFVETESYLQPYADKQKEFCSKLEISWYDRFFWKEDNISRDITYSLLTGTGNYGLSGKSTSGAFLVYPVFSIGEFNDLSILVHEFSHPYCNPLIDMYYSGLEKNASKVFEANREILTRQAYPNARIMLYETLVRASVVNYILEYYPSIDAEAFMNNEEQKGFGMIRAFSEGLIRYRQQKDIYPTLKDYMPALVRYVNSVYDTKQ